MTERAFQGDIDYEQLGRTFRVLGVPTRIQLLRKLQRPLTAAEIRLPPFRKDAGRSEDRPLARQTVEAHLAKLAAIGLVRSRPTTRHGQPANEFLVNQARLFTMADDVRRLTLLRPSPDAVSAGVTASRTADGGEGAGAAVALPDGPALVLVSGPLEGRAFPLSGDGPWIVGRDEGAAVRVDFDPFASGVNAEVWRGGDGWFARDVRGSRNGTLVNWRRLADGEHARIAAGDTLAVGRSLLVVRGFGR